MSQTFYKRFVCHKNSCERKGCKIDNEEAGLNILMRPILWRNQKVGGTRNSKAIISHRCDEQIQYLYMIM